MRWFVVIPALILFLSNVPFAMELPMKDAMAIETNTENCDSKGCSSDESPQSPCDQECDNDAGQDDDCYPDCAKNANATSCVCICCFQYSAPSSNHASLKFLSLAASITKTGYARSFWKDPFIPSPGQPPDMV